MIPAANALTIEWAEWYAAKGLSVIPVRADGSKAPLYAGWRAYSTSRPEPAQLAAWFGGDSVGIGVVPGPASGNLVVLDFEGHVGQDAYAEWLLKLDRPAWRVLASCPVVLTPSGGRHVWVRLADSQPGGRLARFASGRTKVEIRGEGHQVLAPGCPASCHASGVPYRFESEGWLSS